MDNKTTQEEFQKSFRDLYESIWGDEVLPPPRTLPSVEPRGDDMSTDLVYQPIDNNWIRENYMNIPLDGMTYIYLSEHHKQMVRDLLSADQNKDPQRTHAKDV